MCETSPGDSQSLRGKDRNVTLKRKGSITPPVVQWPRSGTNDGEVASRGRVSWEQVEVTAQGATVLRHLLAPVELRARGVAFTLLDECVHLERQKPAAESENLAFP